MMNSFTFMFMDWFLDSRMEWTGSPSLDFSHTRWITLKSKCDSSIRRFRLDNELRILMACIKHLGLCPCPDCRLLKSKIHLLGSKSDISARERFLRTDSSDRRRRIELARRLIFQGVNVTSKRIEDILGSGSMVPTRVRAFKFPGNPQYGLY